MTSILFMADLKLVYRADNEQIAVDELEKLKEKWDKKYPHNIQLMKPD